MRDVREQGRDSLEDVPSPRRLCSPYEVNDFPDRISCTVPPFDLVPHRRSIQHELRAPVHNSHSQPRMQATALNADSDDLSRAYKTTYLFLIRVRRCRPHKSYSLDVLRLALHFFKIILPHRLLDTTPFIVRTDSPEFFKCEGYAILSHR
jgi:hypothetical protein